MTRIFVSIFFVAALCNTAFSEPYMTMGAGTTSCAHFAKRYASDGATAEIIFFSWAQGYISGINMMSATTNKTFKNMADDTKSQMAKIRRYCNEHPLADYSDAVLDVVQSMPLLPYGK